MPKAIIRPGNEAEVITLLQYARQNSTPVTFRAGGTSLSGQSITTGILAETIREWTGYEIEEDGKYIRLQPGVIGSRANLYLKPFSRRIGPDPASMNAARIGGIIANNSSGMVCGIKNNSYHTLKSIRFIMANGNLYDTGIKRYYRKFLDVEKELCEGLTKVKKEIESKPNLIKKIRDKYRIKNTIGYSINAILDYNHPLDIFSHLLVGSEGTLAFTSSVTLETLFDPPFQSTGLAIFDNAGAAMKILPFLINSGADAVELMDSSALKTARFIAQAPYDYRSITNNAAALLFEYQNEKKANLDYLEAKAIREISGQKGKIINGMQRSSEKRALLWNIRKGLYPTVGAMRKAGTSFITEDLCYDYKDLPAVVEEMHSIFKHWNYKDAVIFGHAKDGNLHFVGSADLNLEDGVKNFDGMLNDLVDMTLGKFQGSLKAEHGTGRNMAPFVEREWGPELYKIMWSLKSWADPVNILNPGVLLNRDKTLHLKSIKPMPLIHESIDLCVECGFCEPVCPSRSLTLTPRQRITVARELELLQGTSEYNKVAHDYLYLGTDTCAVDGLCELSCPVNINTGNFVKLQRLNNHSLFARWWADKAVKNFKFVITSARFILQVIHGLIFITGQNLILIISKVISSVLPGNLPQWNRNLPKAASKLPPGSKDPKPDFIYYPTCLTRIMSPNNRKDNLAHIIMDIADICGKILFIPEKIDGCCGTPFSSKGF
ncbi:MAG: FAD-binding and (Fe-S)-binding domain-containing protein, partial [Candidatus Neomarinimicrobiota bacterium]